MKNFLKLVFVTLAAIAMLMLGPWLLIWAINMLVHAGGCMTFTIPFTFWTWLSAMIIGGMSVLPKMRKKNSE